MWFSTFTLITCFTESSFRPQQSYFGNALIYKLNHDLSHDTKYAPLKVKTDLVPILIIVTVIMF